MIAYVEGELTSKNPAFVIVDVNGIGYQVNISLTTYEKIASLDRCRLLTHLVIKEDAHQLYGFYDENERELFRHFISISGIGPNTARMMLSSLSPEELKRAIIRGDAALIQSIKGIGPKSAQRVVIELQDILKKSASEDHQAYTEKNRTVDEALAAMTMLGFPRAQAEKAISRVLREHPGALNVEELIKQSLKAI